MSVSRRPRKSYPDEPPRICPAQFVESVDAALQIAKTLIDRAPAARCRRTGAGESFAAGFQGVRGNTSIEVLMQPAVAMAQ